MFFKRERTGRRRPSFMRSFNAMFRVSRQETRRRGARLAAHLHNTSIFDVAFDYFDVIFFFVDFVGSFLLFLLAFSEPKGTDVALYSYLLGLVMCLLYSIREALGFFKQLDDDNKAHECVYYYPKLYLFGLAAAFFISICMALYILNFKWNPAQSGLYLVAAVALIALYGPGAVLRMHFFVGSVEGPGQGLISSFHALRHWMGNYRNNREMGKLAWAAHRDTDHFWIPPRSSSVTSAPFSHLSDEKQNPKLFLSLWSNVIEPEMMGLVQERGVICADFDSARDRIYAAYLEFNSYCREAYFKDEDALIDRHQIAACLTYAVLVAEPLSVDTARANEYSYYANERLAFTLGCSVLVTFIAQFYIDVLSIEDLNEWRRDFLEHDLNMLRCNGISIPRTVPNEDRYPLTLYRCLRFTIAEGSFSLLTLASLYYLLENDTVSDDLYEGMREYYAARV